MFRARPLSAKLQAAALALGSLTCTAVLLDESTPNYLGGVAFALGLGAAWLARLVGASSYELAAGTIRLADLAPAAAPMVTEVTLEELGGEALARLRPVAQAAVEMHDGLLVGRGAGAVELPWPEAASQATQLIVEVSVSQDAVLRLQSGEGPADQVVSPLYAGPTSTTLQGDSPPQAWQTVELPLPGGLASQQGALLGIAPVGSGTLQWRIRAVRLVSRTVTWCEGLSAVQVRHFDLVRDAQGWIGIGGAVAHHRAGAPLLLSSGQVGGAIWRGLSFEARTVTAVSVTVEADDRQEALDAARLFWGTARHPEADAERSIDVPTAGKGVQTYLFRVSEAPGWRGQIRWLAFMPNTRLAETRARIHAITLSYQQPRRARFWDELRTAVSVPAGGKLTQAVRLGRRPRFTCSLALPEGSGTARLSVTPTGGTPQLAASWSLRPEMAERWVELGADLGRWAGGNALLSLELAGEEGALPWSVANAEVRSLGSRPDKPNILVIDIDALRAQHLSCYGYDLPTSPHIDRLAATSTLFERAYSQATWTLPSHASLFTGKLPTDLAVLFPGDRLQEGEATLAQRLRDAGYATAAFAGGGFMSADFGLDQGFDCYYDVRTDPDIEQTFEHLAGWLAAHQAQPFFLLFHTYEAHDWIRARRHHLPLFLRAPYSGRLAGDYDLRAEVKDPPAWLREEDVAYMRALYDGEIHCTDGYVGRLLGLLGSRRLLGNTMVVLLSDHGELFREGEGGIGHGGPVFNRQLHVPLLIRLPGQRAGRRVSVPVGNDSLYATLLELAGISPPPEVAPPLTHLLSGSREREQAPVMATDQQTWALISGPYKLRMRLPGLVAGRVYPRFSEPQYDLCLDPDEQHNLRDRRLAVELGRQLVERVAASTRLLALRLHSGGGEMTVALGGVDYAVLAGPGRCEDRRQEDGCLLFTLSGNSPYLPLLICRPGEGGLIDITVRWNGAPLPPQRVFLGDSGKHPASVPFRLGDGACTYAEVAVPAPPALPAADQPYAVIYHQGYSQPQQASWDDQRRRQLEALGYM